MTAPDRLHRRLGPGDAVVVGLASMLGTGVFVVWSPAAQQAGRWLLLSLAVAAGVAYCNATSTAELAAVHPESGGAYAYGRIRLGRAWGVVAGWAFVIGKTASCAAAALAVGVYGVPSHARLTAAGVVVLLTAVNLAGVGKTAGVSRVLVLLVLLALTVTVVTAWVDGPRPVLHEASMAGGPGGIPSAAGLFFFAFAGYARVATLGEEVRDPARTIPRAVVISLAVVLAVYLVVGVTLVHVLGARGLAGTSTPLSAAVTGSEVVEGLVRVGAVVAASAVLLPLLAGVARTVFAMASYRDLPAALAQVDARRRVPRRAQTVVGAAVLAVVCVGGLQGAVAVSAASVLIYYAVANAAALRLDDDERRWPRWLAVGGLVGCLALSVSLLSLR